MAQNPSWPPLPLAAWSDTCETVHRWTQVVGKVRMAHAPLVNHWWNVTLYVTSRGLTTSPIPHGSGTFEIAFDLLDHRLLIETSDRARESIELRPMSVAEFYAEVMARLERVGARTRIWTMPSEIPDAVPFEHDTAHAQYDPAMVECFLGALVQSDRVLKLFRSRFLGKASPVHFFWGSFDLAVTRFSGRTAPPPTGVTPNVASWVMAEAYSHEVSSCGFWPGGGAIPYPAFYSYAYPEPAGFSEARVKPNGAFYSTDLREFILPYDVVRQSESPDETLLEFLQATYEGVSNLANWDRASLERTHDPRT
jgi:hypothetical protein